MCQPGRSGVTETVDEVARRVRSACPAARALILTGSTARGEATWLPAAGGARWLSDLECLAVVPDKAALAREGAALDELARRIGEDLARQGTLVAVELTATPERFFRSLRPQLFGYELRVHGRQLFGDRDYLGEIPAFTWKDIPREDAWRLLSNRMVEWLEFQWRRTAMPVDAQFYVLVKQYLDLVTSLSLVAGEYSDRYETRGAALGRLAEWIAPCMPAGAAERLEQGARLALEFKLRPAGEAFGWLAGGGPGDVREGLAAAGLSWFYDGLFGLLAAVWEWELEAIAGVRPEKGRAMRGALGRVYGWRRRARGWGKLMLRPDLRRGKSFWTRAARLFAAGAPRSLVYHCARMLLEAEADRDEGLLRQVKQSMPLLYDGPSNTWEDLAQQCVRNWKSYLRRSYV